MTGRTHMIIGAAVYGTAARAGLFPMEGYGFLAPLIGALLPDIDHRGSAMGRFVWPLALVLSPLVNHRGVTHSLAAVVSIAFGLAAAVAAFPAEYRGVWPAGLIIGYLSHIVADMLTVEGVELFWPNKQNVRVMEMHTGGLGETAVAVLAALWLAFVVKDQLKTIFMDTF